MALLETLFSSMGVSLDAKRETPLHDGWICYSLNHLNPSKEVPIILIERGPKNTAEVKKHVKNFSTCIIFFEEKNTLIFKSSGESHIAPLENDSDYRRIASILKSTGIASAQDEIDLQIAIKQLIDKIPNTTGDFVNRGLFSTHYLRSRVFDDARQDVDAGLDDIKETIGDTDKTLQALGWDISNPSASYYDGAVSITVTGQDDFGIRKSDADVAPSYTAVATLRRSKWAILTNGRRWRLYSARVSSSSTNYFEIVLDPENDTVTRYLLTLFGAESFLKKDEKTDIDTFFDEGKNFGKTVEENLATRIMRPDGLFLDIVKGVLDHDTKKTFSPAELESAKQTSLKIMYRIWFLAYAESRNLLPVRDERYRPLSLQSIRNQLDQFEDKPDGHECWDKLVDLFRGIRNGSKQHNLPQYNGDLFKNDPALDGISIRNGFIAKALYGLLEDDGQAIDYTDFSVRHLGNIFETLMEYSPRQTDKDILLLEDSKGVREVESAKDATYSYKKNDLYLASKGGIVSRKTSASFYTPDEIVKFLVEQGLHPILAEREKLIGDDIRRYKKSGSREDLQTCMDRLLDIQVLDPSMGSGHFLVETLNRITLWATGILKQHTDHPLLSEIESDRRTVLHEQKEKGITIDESLLTADVLLKRRIMKRCIFGVDLNPMAVDLAKLSLWLDSFAIGVPLTYLDHHLKVGDSTIGSFLDDLKDQKNATLDDWSPSSESNRMILDVASSPDITVQQVHASEDLDLEHRKSLEPTKRILDALTASRIDPKILPKRGKDEFIYRFSRYSKTEAAEFVQARRVVNGLAERHHFFHWEIEMMDAFTDSRRGFDLVVGNPPWDLVKPYDNEFFVSHEPLFRYIKPHTKKKRRKEQILKDRKINEAYQSYKDRFKKISSFYSTYDLQGTGARDLWQLILERALRLVADGGMVSLVIPSQLLSSIGTVDLRKHLLKKDIMSMYVFENKKKIFDIHLSYRFILLTIRNKDVSDKNFHAGFYLHDTRCLGDDNVEQEKFGYMSPEMIQKLSPNTCVIPEVVGNAFTIWAKLSRLEKFKSVLGDGWDIKFSSGFHATNNAHMFQTDDRGWPVYEGKIMHQYNHKWKPIRFTVDGKIGLQLLGMNDLHNSFRLVFRDMSVPTNMRTVISTIIPPHTFHTNKLPSVILMYRDQRISGSEYNRKIAYLCGILNSTSFDFMVRAVTQMAMSSTLKIVSVPPQTHEVRIAELAVRLVVGTSEFEGLAESMRVPNISLTPARRIETAAEIDALVAHSYGLTPDEYLTVLESFPAFKKNPGLYYIDEIIWDNNNLKEFYGEMAELAISYFEEIS